MRRLQIAFRVCVKIPSVLWPVAMMVSGTAMRRTSIAVQAVRLVLPGKTVKIHQIAHHRFVPMDRVRQLTAGTILPTVMRPMSIVVVDAMHA